MQLARYSRREKLLSDAKKLFARENTGLVREIGPLTAIIITVAYVIGSGWQRDVFAFTASAPLPENLWLAGIPPAVMAIFIVGIIGLVIMLGYSILAAGMPRSGGGYVAISRIINPFAGFVASWLEFLAISWSFGIIAANVFERALYLVGPSLLPIQAGSYNDVVVALGGMSLIVIFTVISVFGVKPTGYALQVLFWVPAILTLYVLYLLGSAMMNPAVLERGISAWAQSQGVTGVTADTYVKAALAQGLDGANVGDYWTAVSVSLTGAYFVYIGYAATTFVVGEVKNANRNLPKVLIIATIVIIVMYVTNAYFAAYAAASVGQITLPNGNRWSFFDAYSFLSYSGSVGQAGVPALRLFVPTLAAMTGMGLGLGSLNILLFLFAILWIVNDIPPFILTASRILFAMSFDRVLPTSFAKVNNRFLSPVNAVVLVGVFAVFGVLAEPCVVCTGGTWSPGGPVGNVLNGIFLNGIFATDLLDVVFFSLFALAVLLFPFRQRRAFDAAYFKPGGRTGVVAIGLTALIANLIIGWAVLTSSADSYNILAPTSDNWYALGFDLLLGIIGAAIYGYYKWGPSRKQVDYTGIFSEIPPE
jgi:amino acid transporter